MLKFSEFGHRLSSQITQVFLLAHFYLYYDFINHLYADIQLFISRLSFPLSFILIIYNSSRKAESPYKQVYQDLLNDPLVPSPSHNILPLFSNLVYGTITHSIIKAGNLCNNQICRLLVLYLLYSIHHCVLLILLPK